MPFSISQLRQLTLTLAAASCFVGSLTAQAVQKPSFRPAEKLASFDDLHFYAALPSGHAVELTMLPIHNDNGNLLYQVALTESQDAGEAQWTPTEVRKLGDMNCHAKFRDGLLQEMNCVNGQGTAMQLLRSDFDHFKISTIEAKKPLFVVEQAIFGDEAKDLYRKVVRDF